MDDVRMTPRLTFGDPLPPADRNLCASEADEARARAAAAWGAVLRRAK